MRALNLIAFLLVIIGGINWGLVGLFEFNLVSWLFDGWAPALSRIIYVLVGVAALYCIYLMRFIGDRRLSFG